MAVQLLEIYKNGISMVMMEKVGISDSIMIITYIFLIIEPPKC